MIKKVTVAILSICIVALFAACVLKDDTPVTSAPSPVPTKKTVTLAPTATPTPTPMKTSELDADKKVTPTVSKDKYAEEDDYFHVPLREKGQIRQYKGFDHPVPKGAIVGDTYYCDLFKMSYTLSKNWVFTCNITDEYTVNADFYDELVSNPEKLAEDGFSIVGFIATAANGIDQVQVTYTFLTEETKEVTDKQIAEDYEKYLNTQLKKQGAQKIEVKVETATLMKKKCDCVTYSYDIDDIHFSQMLIIKTEGDTGYRTTYTLKMSGKNEAKDLLKQFNAFDEALPTPAPVEAEAGDFIRVIDFENQLDTEMKDKLEKYFDKLSNDIKVDVIMFVADANMSEEDFQREINETYHFNEMGIGDEKSIAGLGLFLGENRNLQLFAFGRVAYCMTNEYCNALKTAIADEILNDEIYRAARIFAEGIEEAIDYYSETGRMLDIAE